VNYAIAALVSAALVLVYAWQDGLMPCNDGMRYTSRRPQPYPFHRRFCGWPKRLLFRTSLASLVAIGALMGDWKHALLLGTLPGFWFIATHPTTVDGPAMLLALAAALLWPVSPAGAIAVSCASGFIHERGPVFAALYAWHPALLVGLVMMGWWRRPAPPDEDPLVGRGLKHAMIAHKQYNDWLEPLHTGFALRGLPLIAAWAGVSPQAWLTLGVAWCSRIVGTDLGRFAFWAAPVMVRELPDVPVWMVLAQAMTFRRMG
jgi:hypothetical protein